MWDVRVDFDLFSTEQLNAHKAKKAAEYTALDHYSKMDYWSRKKARTEGNVSFIGELINKKFLPFKVFYYGVNTLLKDYLLKYT